jgi:class 3 adenylate cyclase/YHS domain-containing protein
MASTFAFVDLAGYTAAAWAHGDDVAARLAITLHDLAGNAAGPKDRIVKSIGDAVMCQSADPRSSLEWHARLFDAVAAEEHLLELRAGCHHGDAVEHEGDFYGTTINIAARLAALAGPCELLATAEVAAAGRTLGWAVSGRGDQRLRNIAEPVGVWAIGIPTAGRAPTIDPVCQMRLTPGAAKGILELDGRTYEFCSDECHDRFMGDPTSYVTTNRGGEPYA